MLLGMLAMPVEKALEPESEAESSTNEMLPMGLSAGFSRGCE
jgi:hypothetical protein